MKVKGLEILITGIIQELLEIEAGYDRETEELLELLKKSEEESIDNNVYFKLSEEKDELNYGDNEELLTKFFHIDFQKLESSLKDIPLSSRFDIDDESSKIILRSIELLANTNTSAQPHPQSKPLKQKESVNSNKPISVLKISADPSATSKQSATQQKPLPSNTSNQNTSNSKSSSLMVGKNQSELVDELDDLLALKDTSTQKLPKSTTKSTKSQSNASAKPGGSQKPGKNAEMQDWLDDLLG
ncbi:hypothetical protein HK098_000744 [Nowakowskiella sp. JEL0407]|nr:hypothetical protein HK098_000744 [Nowakowskiella sp. JEL0407]